MGTVLDNCDDDGLGGCYAISAKTVKVTGSNIFNGNGTVDENGLLILSLGAISVSNLTASGNIGSGAYIDNALSNANGVESVGAWALTGYGFFNDNGGDGLEAYTYGNMTLLNINASDNGVNGAYLITDKYTGGSSFTLSGSNIFSGNVDCGLCVAAAGVITISNLTANENGGVGAFLDNRYDPIKPFNITIKGSNNFNQNGNEGLVALTHGAILASNLTANSNGSSNEAGVVLDNCNEVVSFCDTAIAKTIVVTGYLNASRNAGYGADIASLGAVTLNNILAELNANSGVIIKNNYDPTKAQTVALKGSNSFNYNGGNGLELQTYGAVATNNLTAFRNDLSGATFDNTGGVTPKNIILTGSNIFLGNGADGLNFNASGSVTLNRINADGNGVSSGNGITGVAGTSITLACVHIVNQANGSGYDLSAAVSITISGAVLYNNSSLNTTHTTPTVTVIHKPCVLP